MTIRELKETIERLQLDDDVEIFIHADHGQNEERADFALPSRSKVTYGDEMVWEYGYFEEDYDEDVIEEYDVDGKITAICICS
ncbi:MAG: hypothetical protein ACRDD7_15565 [Peptostreptococcaceae bacterium]